MLQGGVHRGIYKRGVYCIGMHTCQWGAWVHEGLLRHPRGNRRGAMVKVGGRGAMLLDKLIGVFTVSMHTD